MYTASSVLTAPPPASSFDGCTVHVPAASGTATKAPAASVDVEVDAGPARFTTAPPTGCWLL